MSWRDHILRYGDTQIACFVCLSYAGPAKEDHKTVLHSVAQHSPSWNYAFKKTGTLVFVYYLPSSMSQWITTRFYHTSCCQR